MVLASSLLLTVAYKRVSLAETDAGLYIYTYIVNVDKEH